MCEGFHNSVLLTLFVQAAGLDSLGAVELKNALQEQLSIRLPPTVVIDHPTIAGLTRFVAQQLVPAGETAAAASTRSTHGIAGAQLPIAAASSAVVPESAVGPVARSRALAVLAAVERLPSSHAGAGTSGVVQGVDAAGLVPVGRWDIESPATASTEARWVGMCTGGSAANCSLVVRTL